MPIWDIAFRTAEVQADENDYREGYHQGHVDGLSAVDEDLRPGYIMLGVNIFGAIGTLLWAGPQLTIDILCDVATAIVSPDASISVAAEIMHPSVLMQVSPTASVSLVAAIANAIVSPDVSVDVGAEINHPGIELVVA